MNYLRTISIALIVGLLVVACDPEKTVKVTDIEITSTPSPLALTVGEKGKLDVTIIPSDATDKNIEWSVEPKGIVEIDADWNVTALAPGDAVITGKASSDRNATGTVDVTVTEPERAADSYTGTLIVMAGTKDEFTLEDVEVTFTVADDEATVDIEMLKVKFAEAMPVKLDVLISGVTLTGTTGGYTISCGEEGIVPTAMNGQQFPAYIFTEMEGSATTTTLLLEMKSGGDPMTFEGAAVAENK